MHDQIDTIMRRAANESSFSGVCLITRGDDIVYHRAIGLETAVMPSLDRASTKISDAVSVYHLLTHTPGIADDADEEAIEKDGDNVGVAAQFIHYPDHDTSLVLLASLDCIVQKIVRHIEPLFLDA